MLKNPLPDETARVGHVPARQRRNQQLEPYIFLWTFLGTQTPIYTHNSSTVKTQIFIEQSKEPKQTSNSWSGIGSTFYVETIAHSKSGNVRYCSQNEIWNAIMHNFKIKNDGTPGVI